MHSSKGHLTRTSSGYLNKHWPAKATTISKARRLKVKISANVQCCATAMLKGSND
jgi:hypothetical protein